MLTFTRRGKDDPLGLLFDSKSPPEAGLSLGFNRLAVKVASVEPSSTADEAGFRSGDVLIAINNVPVRSERQATRMLCGTAGDLLVLVERDLSFKGEGDEESGGEFEAKEVMVPGGGGGAREGDEEFVCIQDKRKDIARSISFCEPSPTTSPTTSTTAAVDTPDTTPSPTFISISTSLPLPAGHRFIDSAKALPKVSTTPIDDIHELMMDRQSPPLRMKRRNTPTSSSNTPTPTSAPIPTFAFEFDFDSPTSLPRLTVQRPSYPDLKRSRSTSELGSWKVEVSATNPQKETATDSPKRDSISTTTTSTSVESDPKQSHPPPPTRKERLAERIHAGRAKVNSLIWRGRAPAKDVSPSNSCRYSSSAVLAEVGTEAAVEAAEDGSSLLDPETYSIGGGGGSPKRPTEIAVADRGGKRKWIGRRRGGKSKSPTPSMDSQGAVRSPPGGGGGNEVVDGKQVGALITLRDTRPLPLNKNVLWGQSLHFGLENKRTRYLTVKVFARPKRAVGQEEEAAKPILLGYTSIYIPQIIDDCTLTLSNCHREMFPLRPPSEPTSEALADFADLKTHSGFDARLCYGDITLGFRFFPQGLPDTSTRVCSDSPNNKVEGEQANATATSTANHSESVEDHPLREGRTTPDQATAGTHKWMPVHLKHGSSCPCGVCNGKIWTKWGSRCSMCSFICHEKCVEKANTQQECVPNLTADAAAEEEEPPLEVIEQQELEADPSSTAAATHGDTPQTSRRRRIANKMSDKITTTWKSVGASRVGKKFSPKSAGGEDLPAPTDIIDPSHSQHSSPSKESIKEEELVSVFEVLDAPFLHSLKGAPEVRQLKFEPGNAYHAEVIGFTKKTGQNVFSEVEDTYERKRLINEQIDAIQKMITALHSAVDGDAPAKEDIDIKREALALLMLHYCSGLSDCIDKEEEQEAAAAKKGDDQ